MDTSVGNLVVTVQRTEREGTAWIVRVYKKGFPFKRIISTDWFLDEIQANQFAQRLTEQLHDGAAVQQLKDRRPGWSTLKPS